MNRYHIAGLTVDMDVFGRTERQAEAYRLDSDGPADITFTCDVRKVLEWNPHIKDEDSAMYMGSGAVFTQLLLAHDGTFLHASAVILDGKAYLFSADSGVGKSTHAEKWCRLFGATCLNDDKPALRLENGQWIAYGTPWSGKFDKSSPEGVPLGGIAFLQRSQDNRICPMAPEQAVGQIMRQSMWRLEMGLMEKQLVLVDKLVRQVPIWELYCRNDDDAAILSREMMTGKQ